MLCTFTVTPDRSMVIRSEDIRGIVDMDNQETRLTWIVGDDIHQATIQGTARENMARLQQEEIDAVLRINAYRQHIEQGNAPPIPASMRPRGKVR